MRRVLYRCQCRRPPSSHLVILNTPVRLVGEGNDPSATVIDGEHQYRIIRLLPWAPLRTSRSTAVPI